MLYGALASRLLMTSSASVEDLDCSSRNNANSAALATGTGPEISAVSEAWQLMQTWATAFTSIFQLCPWAGRAFTPAAFRWQVTQGPLLSSTPGTKKAAL